MTALSPRPLSLLLLLALTGCALPGGAPPPAPPLAEQWRNPAGGHAELDRQWWQGFGSPS